ncbi:phytanoyl- dioxygenase [Sarocladium implicatum]|nr:phytanoyl- dioxygenase [Sarocladium implicatum]
MRGPGTSKFPSPDNPRKALLSPHVAQLFHHYITSIAPWYDLSDAALNFGTKLPVLALDSPLLFSAVIALSAMQTSKTVSPKTQDIADYYHGHCVRLLIALDTQAGLAEREIALSTACLLRTYEIQDEETDPNRHLAGAFSLASSSISGIVSSDWPLLAAGFWNYLREDITYGLFEGRALKMDLSHLPSPTDFEIDQVWLNVVTIRLGQILNAYMKGALHSQCWHNLHTSLRSWRQDLPAHCDPFSRSEPMPGDPFPKVWMMQDCHAASRHYYLVALYLLSETASEEDLDQLCAMEVEQSETREDFLEWCALEIVGIAFTSTSKAVLVNAFGPIFFCSRSIRSVAAREELIRLLNPCSKTIGWPIQRMVTSMELRWGRRR